jgi:2-methylisocitrate lyase-like PEP mutase family enzyme
VREYREGTRMANTGRKSGAQILRERLKRPEILVAPGCYDVLSARLVEQAGFEAAFMTGFGASGSILGQPDYGLMTMNEMATVCVNMNAVLSIPLIGDIDTGYGNPLNVYRTVREFERAGMAAVHLEDQVFPKRCGHMEKKVVIPTEEYVEKLRAALDAREEMLIIARTDSRAVFGVEEAVRRLETYRDVGADVVYADALADERELRMVGAIEGVYKFSNQVESGRTPLYPTDELQNMGYDIVIYPCSTVFAAAKAMQRVLSELKSKHTTRDFLKEMTTFTEYGSVVGMETLLAREQRYKIDELKSKLKQK